MADCSADFRAGRIGFLRRELAGHSVKALHLTDGSGGVAIVLGAALLRSASSVELCVLMLGGCSDFVSPGRRFQHSGRGRVPLRDPRRAVLRSQHVSPIALSGVDSHDRPCCDAETFIGQDDVALSKVPTRAEGTHWPILAQHVADTLPIMSLYLAFAWLAVGLYLATSGPMVGPEVAILFGR